MTPTPVSPSELVVGETINKRRLQQTEGTTGSSSSGRSGAGSGGSSSSAGVSAATADGGSDDLQGADEKRLLMQSKC